MATYTKAILSGSTNGRQIKVGATSSPGTTIHTAIALDEIWLWAYNSDGSPHLLTLQWGGTTAPDDSIAQYIQSQVGWVPIATGLVLSGTLLVKAFADLTNVVMIGGYVNSIS